MDLWEGKLMAKFEVGQVCSGGVPFQRKPQDYQVRVVCEYSRKLGKLILVQTFPLCPALLIPANSEQVNPLRLHQKGPSGL